MKEAGSVPGRCGSSAAVVVATAVCQRGASSGVSEECCQVSARRLCRAAVLQRAVAAKAVVG